MIQYTPIDSILTMIPSALKKETEVDNILSYALDAYRLLNLPLQTQKQIKILEVENHTAVLPSDVQIINLVTFSKEAPPQDSFVIENTETTDYNLFYRIWQDSSAYNDYFMPMRNAGNSSSISCKCCNNPLLRQCNESFSITPDKTFLTSVKEGFICLDYDRTIIDDEGRFLIVNTIEVKRYLSLYAMAMCWLERASSKEENALQMYKTFLIEAEIAMKKARGIQIMKSIDINTVSQITENTQQVLNLPSKFYKLNNS